MSTLAQTPRAEQRSPSRVGMAVAAVGTLVAIAVAIVFLTLPGSSRTTTATHSAATHGRAAASAPLIQYRGTGAPPVRPLNQSAPVLRSTPLRHVASYGAVP
jgi:hypothetical protein